MDYYFNHQPIRGQDKTLGRDVFLENFHHVQSSWDIDVNLKATVPLQPHPKIQLAAEVGAPVAQDFQVHDQLKLNTQFYASAGINALF